MDTSGLLVLEYPGFTCHCVGAKDCAAINGVQIVGEKGYIHVTPSGSNCQYFWPAAARKSAKS